MMTGAYKHKTTICFNADDKKLKTVSLKNGRLVHFSKRSPIKETPNEDSLAIIYFDNKTTILIVADGMGGMPAGEQASMIVINSLIHNIDHVTDKSQIRNAILDGIKKANETIIDLKINSGSTVSVVEIHDDELQSYYVGDSLILLMSHDGNIKHQSVSHSPIGHALQCGIIGKEHAMLHQNRHLISNYVGMPSMYIQVDPTLRLTDQDTLIIASDALSDNLYEQEIVTLIGTGPLIKSAYKMIEKCQHNMLNSLPDRLCHPDDLTFISFRYK